MNQIPPPFTSRTAGDFFLVGCGRTPALLEGVRTNMDRSIKFARNQLSAIQHIILMDIYCYGHNRLHHALNPIDIRVVTSFKNASILVIHPFKCSCLHIRETRNMFFSIIRYGPGKRIYFEIMFRKHSPLYVKKCFNFQWSMVDGNILNSKYISCRFNCILP